MAFLHLVNRIGLRCGRFPWIKRFNPLFPQQIAAALPAGSNGTESRPLAMAEKQIQFVEMGAFFDVVKKNEGKTAKYIVFYLYF